MVDILYTALRICLVILGISLTIFSTCYHILFKPDYRPGFRTMPFVWFQMVTTIYKQSQKAFCLSKMYNVYTMNGMCQIFEHQKIFSLSICGKAYVFLFTPEAAKVVLSSPRLIEKSSDYEGINIMLGDGLFSSKGNKWRNRRKMLTPTFHFKILEDFAPVMAATTKQLVTDLEAFAEEPWVDVMGIMKNCSFTILLKTTLGFEIDINTEEATACLKASDEFTTCLSARLARPWLFADVIFNLSALSKRIYKCRDLVHGFLRKVILAKKNDIEKLRKMRAGIDNGLNQTSSGEKAGRNSNLVGKKKNKAFLDLLLELHFNDNSFTEEDILDETLSFFGAGAETLGTALCYALHCIGLYLDVQKKIQDELVEIFQDSERDTTVEDLKSMKYLECAIKESLRLYSPSYVSRKATENFKVYDYVVPRGSTVVIFNYMIHRDQRAYPNPEMFDPSRFFPENCSGRHPYAFLPFSAGPRNCIGQKFTLMEMKTVCSAILRKFDIKSLDNRDQIYEITNLASKSNVPVRIQFSLRKKRHTTEINERKKFD